MQQTQLIPHLFRSEFGKITAVLCKLFNADFFGIEIAEDIASETFLSAMESWSYKGAPENPTAWLYTVAKNKAKNYLHRHSIYDKKVLPQLQAATEANDTINIDLSEKNITDSQLQMLFAICHPAINTAAQIGLALRILCGFGIDEIATALLSNKETISKRLVRAKEKLRTEKVPIEFPGNNEIEKRLETVLTTLYLLFNEGYYSESNDAVIREELCLEAMRLNYLLIENEQTNLPAVNALLALMCFHASRFAARKNEAGEIILYNNQDENLWDKELIAKGVYFLHQSAKGKIITKYHLEANIAYQLTIKEDTKEKWDITLQLYNQLLQAAYSPIAALNRTYALSKLYGKEKAIAEAEKLQLNDNHFYFTLLGELYSGVDNEKALTNFEKGFVLAKTVADKQVIKEKIKKLKPK